MPTRLPTAARLLLVALACGVSAATSARSPRVDPFVEAVRLAERPVVQTSATSGALATDHGLLPPAYGVEGGFEPLPVAAPPVGAVAGWGYDSGPGFGWQLMPDGLIYRSYLAGPREPRLALHSFNNRTPIQKSENLWDATLGGRRGILRYGDYDPVSPVGWQLDLEGAAIVRLNLDENRDVDASDFRFGVPLTYTAGDGVAYKFGYYHVSSHLGDELIARTGVNNRVNYVRDAIILGVSRHVTPDLRVYGEMAWAFFTAGGAEPWEFQFGAEWSHAGPTGFAGTPFLATNAHLREEVDFGGDWTLQAGWLWRGDTGSTLRVGLHYMNGQSTQYQFFDRWEEQIGAGLWMDF
ncbi:DUF1207 domain-containing protein [Botrimarina sp.]|uniref:DUF1207 domain-containing protein n=1 Tax=Botrimarina sp. TaxID=2795802 RepID=UPI0032EF2898